MSVDIDLKEQTWAGVNKMSVPLEGGGRQVFSLGSSTNLQTKSVTYTPTTSQQTDQVRPDTGYDGLSLVNVIINAMAGGVDIPTFTLSGVQDGSTVTCDKTYAEVRALYDDGLLVALADAPTYNCVYAMSICDEPGASSLRYAVLDANGYPMGDVLITSSAMTYSVPSVTQKTMNLPTATKGTVTNHTMTIGVGVANSRGFYAGGVTRGNPIYVSASELVSGTKSISANGTGIDVTNYESVDVSVPTGGATLQTKSATYTPTTSQQTDTITPDSGYDGMDEVDITINAVPSGSVTAPSSISGTNATINAITQPTGIRLTKTVSVTPNVTQAGYISSGTAGTTEVSLLAQTYLSNTRTITPTTTDQTIPANTYIVGTQTISGDANLVAGNIKSGTTIFGVTGTYTGGASNFVTGTFTTGSSAGHTEITIPYTGSGYPIMCVVVVDGGAYASGTSWYNSTQRYAIGQWTMTKSNMSTTPSYTTSGAQNQGVITAIYKNSTSSSTSYTRTSAMNTNVFSSNNASNSAANTIKLKSGNVLSYYVNTSSYGLHPNITYRYFIVYS